jgi:2',3'-cyclic-nucleotide 2'-phosphodiesterase (5'-nucleotidase family)
VTRVDASVRFVRKLLSRLVFLAAIALLPAAAVCTQEQPAFRKGAQVTLLQINDVYETGPVNGLGGLARVATLKRNVAAAGSTPLVILAGDFLSSSVASSIFKGKQMIDGLNAMGLDIATLGNHEFDFGKDILLQRMAESKFQYVVANIIDQDTGRPVGGAAAYTVRSFNGLKVGFFGLCLVDDEISREKRRGLQLLNPLDAAKGSVTALQREGADVIVAITHLSYGQDRELARRYPEINVIVGGHEHYPIDAVVGSTFISKAGSDAKFVARIDLHRDQHGLERLFSLIPIDATLADDARTAEVVAEYESKLSGELEVVVGGSDVPLDADSRRIRTSESGLGNLIADAMRADAGSDIAIINSGSIRGDRVYAAGPLTRRTLLAMQPFGNVNCKIDVPGRIILDALNHGVSKLPASAGQFPQVSGLTLKVDVNVAGGARVRDVRVGGRLLDPAQTYSVAMPDYLLNGGDGYSMFAGFPVMVGPEAGTLLVNVLEKYLAQQRTVAPRIEGRITTN